MTDETPPDASVVLDLLEAFRRSKTMFAAVTLGVFDALESGPTPADELAAAAGADRDAFGRLLDACVGLRLLTRDGDRYANTPAARTYLCKSSPRRFTGYLAYSNEILWKLWANLEDGIREGTHRWKQTYGWEGSIFDHVYRTAEARREFLLGMHGYGQLSSPAVVKAFDLSRFRTLVDLGGATGHLAAAACQQYPSLEGVVFDLPEVVPMARAMLDQTPVADRVKVVPGNFFTDDFPAADLYAVGRILHDWAEPKIMTLLRKVHDRLPSGGALLVAEKLLNPDRSGPMFALMQSLNMLLVTEGKERTLAEYEALLKQAGFAEVHGRATDSPLDAVLAVKG